MIALQSALHRLGVGGKMFLGNTNIYDNDTLLATASNQSNFGLVDLS